jgi:MFS transporter, DHA1 family, tetracycline resistance protein
LESNTTVSQKPNLFPIFFVVAVDILSFTIVLPLLPFYAQSFGATPSQVGWIVALFALCQFLAGPTLGRLSDIYGRRPLLIVSQIGTCVGFVILALSNNLAMVFLARVIDGITAGNLTIAQAYVSDVTKPEERGKAYGIIGIAFGLGFFIGPAMSAFLSEYGLHYPAWAAAVLSLLSVIATSVMLPESYKPTGVRPSFHYKDMFKVFDTALLKRYWIQPQFRSLLLQFFLFNFSFAIYIAGFAMFAERRFTWDGKPFGAKEVGYLYTYLGLFGIVVQGFLLGKLIKKMGERKVAIWGFLFQGVGYGAIGWVFKIPWLVGVQTVGSFGAGVLRPALTALLSRSGHADEQGVLMGVAQSVASVATIFVPLIAGYLIEAGFLEAWAALSGLSALLGLLLCLRTPLSATLRT